MSPGRSISLNIKQVSPPVGRWVIVVGHRRKIAVFRVPFLLQKYVNDPQSTRGLPAGGFAWSVAFGSEPRPACLLYTTPPPFLRSRRERSCKCPRYTYFVTVALGKVTINPSTHKRRYRRTVRGQSGCDAPWLSCICNHTLISACRTGI